MQAHKIHVVIPEDRRTTIDFPETIPPGPVELIVLVPSTEKWEEKGEFPSQNRGRLAALAAELARDPRPFRELPPEEREARVRRIRGAGRGLTSGSEEFARRKLEEVEIEERKFGH
jgi:hypothetical protein